MALRAIAEQLISMTGGEIFACAPLVEQSGKGRGVTLTEPLRVTEFGPRDFAVTGTPADCVQLAIDQLMPQKPDLVLSGVNRGQNLAEDTSVSGTVAGAFQGMALGVPSLALSQAVQIWEDGAHVHWDTAISHGPDLIRRLLTAGWPSHTILNINFPPLLCDQVCGFEVTRQGFRDLHNLHATPRTDLRGKTYYWMGFRGEVCETKPGTDLAAMAEGKISISPLHLDLTDLKACQALSLALTKGGPGQA